jgi:hypothetical protein
MRMNNATLRTLRFLLARLERISADSVTAHRASGVRGALLRELERLEKTGAGSGERASRLIERGYALLEQAAEEKMR